MENCNISYHNCRLCARECGIDRERGELGYCRAADVPVIARAALHAWEEPIISGNNGSGTIFFSHCSLGCVYCQNNTISRGNIGVEVSCSHIADIMLRLESEGAHNINFVTPTHYAPSVIEAVRCAREQGLSLPIVYNTASYDSPDTIRALSDTVDIFLPDLKYYRAKTAGELSFASNYRAVALSAIDEMVRQQPMPVIENGIMKSGVIVRILLLPGHVAEAKLNLKYVYERYRDNIYVSLMSQYTPMPGMKPPLDRRVTHAEYNELLSYAAELGLTRAFTQEISSSAERYIPDFDLTGI